MKKAPAAEWPADGVVVHTRSTVVVDPNLASRRDYDIAASRCICKIIGRYSIPVATVSRYIRAAAQITIAKCAE